MKKLYIIRHAKSDWGSGIPDFDRPLNERGKCNALEMGRRFVVAGVVPDVIITSPAVRAETTAKMVAEAMGLLEDKIVAEAEIYEAGLRSLEAVVRSIDDDFDIVMLFGHNPGFSSLASAFCEEAHVTNMPTCAVVGLDFDIDSWADIEENSGKLLIYDYPQKG